MVTRVRRTPHPPLATDGRARLVRAIRAACGRLGMTDEDRYARTERLFPGKQSLSDLTPGQLGQLLDDLNRGWKKPQADRPHIAKLRALWISLHACGIVDDPSDSALSAFVRRHTNIEQLRFIDHENARVVIEALKAWGQRSGITWWSADKVSYTERHIGRALRPGEADRHAVLMAIGEKLRSLGKLGAHMVFDRALPLNGHGVRAVPHDLSDRELDNSIRFFGAELRRFQAKGTDAA